MTPIDGNEGREDSHLISVDMTKFDPNFIELSHPQL